MSSTKNIHDVSANLFFLLAFAYVFAALALRNDFYSSTMIFGMRILDIPFALVALLYAGSGLILQINEGQEEDEGSAWNLVIIAGCVLMFGLVVFVNFALPSQL